MAITLKINVPNIASLIPTYDVIRVSRSIVSSSGPFTDLTSTTPQAATLTGAVAGPFADLNGKTLILRVKDSQGTHPDVDVTFTDPNPISATQVIAAINATSVAAVASQSLGQIVLTTNATGQSANILIAGGSSLADLGFAFNQADSGEDAFITLVAGQKDYTIVDPDGSNAYWYRWQFYNTVTTASTAVTAPIHPQSAVIDPNRKIQDFRATKGLTLLRNREHTFRMAFWQDEAANIPLIPDASGLYPIYTIFDINGERVASGRADLDGSAPNYKAIFLVPQDAILSHDDRRWRIEWFFKTNTGRENTVIDEFDVRDVDVTESESRDQRYLAVENEEFRLEFRQPSTVDSISVKITASDDQSNVIVPSTSVIPYVIDGDTVVYYFDIPSGLLAGGVLGFSYTAMWSIRRTPSSSTEFDFQIIDVPPYKVYRFFVSLRQEIDKAQKRRGTIQAYEDSDIFEYLRQGLNYINGVFPASLNWNLTNVPPPMEPYWLMASLLWALHAQQLCEIDVAFAFSGQEISLDYDRASALEAAIGRALQVLDAGAKTTKQTILRASSAIGSYAGRTPRLTGNNNFIYPISKGGSQSFLGLLQSVGLL